MRAKIFSMLLFLCCITAYTACLGTVIPYSKASGNPNSGCTACSAQISSIQGTDAILSAAHGALHAQLLKRLSLLSGSGAYHQTTEIAIYPFR